MQENHETRVEDKTDKSWITKKANEIAAEVDTSLDPAVMAMQMTALKPEGSWEMMLLDRITVDPKILQGCPCIRGMRFPVSSVVRMVAEGMSANEITEEYPYLDLEDVRQSLRYAAAAADESTNDFPGVAEAMGVPPKQDAGQTPFLDGYEGEIIRANDLIPKTKLIRDSDGNRIAVELDYQNWDKLLEYLEDLEDIWELSRMDRSTEEYVPLERVKEDLRAKGIDV